MEAFFSGTVIILYFLSRYAAEPIFVASCFLPALFGAATMLRLRFGAAGRMIAADRRARPFRKRGVVGGKEREAFFKRCVKGAPPAYRAGYSLFLEGKVGASELTLIGTRALSLRPKYLLGTMVAVGACASLAVFLTFYFSVPIGETLLRTAICAFHASVCVLAYRLLVGAFFARAERAAARFSASLDTLLLRDKPLSREASLPVDSILPPLDLSPSPGKAPDPDLAALKAMLRDLEHPAGEADPNRMRARA